MRFFCVLNEIKKNSHPNKELLSQASCKDPNDELREYLKTGKCKTRHCDRSRDDDGDEIEDLNNGMQM